VVESLVNIAAKDLRPLLPKYHGEAIELRNTILHPGLKCLRLFRSYLELVDIANQVQRFALAWKRVGFGNEMLFVCEGCDRRVRRLYGVGTTYGCHDCHSAVYFCQTLDRIGRKRFAASKKRLLMGGLPDTGEPIPPRRRLQFRRTYQRDCKALERLESLLRGRTFQKRLDTKVFRYYVA
jgi:hypothetical protein